MAKRIQKTAFAALTVAVTAGQREYVLIPDGEFRSSDGSGRPLECAAWRNSAEIAARVIARAQSRTADMVVDYEHQTLLKNTNGQPAPRAGRIERRTLRYEPGVGIVGVIDWADRAAALIGSGEYAYLSPVFPYDEQTGEVLALLHVALTNDPGLDLPAVALSAAFNSSTEEDHPVDLLKKLLAALGLPDTTSEDDAITAVGALAEKAKAATEKVAAMSAATPDPEKFVSVKIMQDMQGQLAALSAQVTGDKVGQVVEQALADGKLLPAQKEWALDLGKSNLAALTAFVEKTPAIAALLGTQTGGKGGGEGGLAVLTAEESAVAAQFGLTNDEFLKGKAAA